MRSRKPAAPGRTLPEFDKLPADLKASILLYFPSRGCKSCALALHFMGVVPSQSASAMYRDIWQTGPKSPGRLLGPPRRANTNTRTTITDICLMDDGTNDPRSSTCGNSEGGTISPDSHEHHGPFKGQAIVIKLGRKLLMTSEWKNGASGCNGSPASRSGDGMRGTQQSCC